MKLALHGATGRMGQTLARLCRESSDIQLVGAIAAAGDPGLGSDIGQIVGGSPLGVAVGADVGSGLLGAEVVIDFSTATAVTNLAKAASRAGIGIVSGTTGLADQARAALQEASRRVPVLWAGNMSLGIQVLSELVEQALSRLGAGFDVEILELHHRNKLDAPSGTAQRLLEAVRASRNNAREIPGRTGKPGARSAEEVGVFSLRGGDVIGDHTVLLLGQGERIELTHRATSRDLFARGALRAARFIAGKPPGQYSIGDVVAGK